MSSSLGLLLKLGTPNFNNNEDDIVTARPHPGGGRECELSSDIGLS